MRVCLREKDICIYELNRYMYSNKLPINKASYWVFFQREFSVTPQIDTLLISWRICLFEVIIIIYE